MHDAFLLNCLDLLEEPTLNQSLVNQLMARFVSSTFHDSARDYLPASCIEKLITTENIEIELGRIEKTVNQKILQDHNYAYRIELADWICATARKTFAIVIQCDLDPLPLLLSMAMFREFGFDDKDLPLADPQATPPSRTMFDRRIWTGLKLRDFHDKQWRCLVPVFSPEKYDYNLLHNCIFPFTKESVTPKVGAFSSVYKVRVHKDHQRHKHLKHVAIKEIQVTRGNDKKGTDDAWEKEAGALANINKLNHPHIISCIAAIRRGDSRYFMFAWADGDSLRDYWVKTGKQLPNADRIHETLHQLKGLADAIHCLHQSRSQDRREESNGTTTSLKTALKVQLRNEHDEETEEEYRLPAKSIRHGDLKPENLLRFLTRNSDETSLGTLKIADMGLAKQHIVATQDRTHLTSTRYGTIQYEAPEAVANLTGPRSRLYDVWSMGCITLEFVIWLLYGNDELNNFYTQVKGESTQHWQYFEMPAPGEIGQAQVHRVVLRWIKAMQETDPDCSTDSALGDLLKLVKEKLLIVPLPPSRESLKPSDHPFAPPALGDTVTRYRATAKELREALDDILSRTRTPGYLCTQSSRDHVKLPTLRSTMLSPNAAVNRQDGHSPSVIAPLQDPILSGVLGRPIRTADYGVPPRQDWEFSVDNIFARTLAARILPQELSPLPPTPSELCDRCSNLDFWVGGLSFEDTIQGLQDRAKTCDLCKLLSEVCEENASVKGSIVAFERKQSNILVVGDIFPVLSIFRSPDLDPPTQIQLGFPVPPQPRTETSFEVLKLWLEDCNRKDPAGFKHQGCHVTARGSLPTRLIYVGTLESPSLCLVETCIEGLSDKEYIALSHPWGDTKTYPPFCTTRQNIDKFRMAISYDDLPATFADAVLCTRKLGVHYLWIDSICIIQGDDGDFDSESKRMEGVFSGAYCVFGASRATNQQDGFLHPRPERNYVTFQRNNEKPFYVSKTIDNFSKDVIEGSLNKRGWVLQERALARRTIYFTDTQNYFECGDGIRCETLTKMQNKMSDFLGDPRFPAKAMKADRAEKIAYFQGLYKQYSRLNFTRYDDRPFAIAGLEKRLQSAFGTNGGFGIFDDGNKSDGGLFHRSLLWLRGEEEGDDKFLTPIEFLSGRNVRVPSWSWMAYKGGIDYTDPPFRSADWEMKELRPPWTRGGNLNTDSAPHDGEVALLATVRDFTVAGRRQDEVKLTYDTERTTASDGQRAQCVIVARSKEGRSDRDRRHYVLLVTPTQKISGRGEKVYERVGAGFMLGKYIFLDKPGIVAKIF